MQGDRTLPRIGIVIGSTRPKHVCPAIVEWVRATDEHEHSLQGLHMRNTATNPALETNRLQLKADGAFVDIGASLEPFAGGVRSMTGELSALLAESLPAGDA